MRVLMDMRTGEPVLDPVGNLKECNIARAFNQYLDVMLHTPIFTEPDLPTWGIPIKYIFQLSFNVNWENMIKYYISQALNPRFEPLIRDLIDIQAERDGSTINLSVHVTSKYGTDTQIEVKLYE